jgi:hypothetical protein
MRRRGNQGLIFEMANCDSSFRTPKSGTNQLHFKPPVLAQIEPPARHSRARGAKQYFQGQSQLGAKVTSAVQFPPCDTET